VQAVDFSALNKISRFIILPD